VSYNTSITSEIIDVDDGDDEKAVDRSDGTDDDEDVPMQSYSFYVNRRISFNDLKTLSLELENECIKLKNDRISKLCVGILSKTLNVLKDPNGADTSWVSAEVAKYAESFFVGCKESVGTRRFLSNKRKKK